MHNVHLYTLCTMQFDSIGASACDLPIALLCFALFCLLCFAVPKRHLFKAQFSPPDRSSIPRLGNAVSYGFILSASIKLVMALPGRITTLFVR